MSQQARMSSEERRDAILKAALKLFSERGFRGTTTRALAEEVGVTEPVLYEHFKSKRDLYLAIIDAKSREGMARGMALVMPYAEARDDRGFFLRLGEFILECHSADPSYSRLLLLTALEDAELGNVFYERQSEGREQLAEYIRLRIEEGAFREVDPRIAARAFASMFAWHANMGVLYHDTFIKKSRSEVVEGMVDIFLRGILAADPRGR
jgi:AcrR family transcriptional regulator